MQAGVRKYSRLFCFKEDTMTIQEAISLTDELKANMMVSSTKIRFLSELEGKLYKEIFTKHADVPVEECPTYDESTDTSTEMLVPAPYDFIYVRWLISQIDIMNQEMDKYNNDRALFENAWTEFGDYWRREHMPVSTAQRFII